MFGVGRSDGEVEVVCLHTTNLWIAPCKQPQFLADAGLFYTTVLIIYENDLSLNNLFTARVVFVLFYFYFRLLALVSIYYLPPFGARGNIYNRVTFLN